MDCVRTFIEALESGEIHKNSARANDFLPSSTEKGKHAQEVPGVGLRIFRIKKKREITVETTQQIVISASSDHPVTRCRICAGQAGMVTTEQAAVMIGVSSRAIYQSVESGQLHFAETSEGQGLVCVQSLFAVSSKRILPEPQS
jgi:hypothetical protein